MCLCQVRDGRTGSVLFQSEEMSSRIRSTCLCREQSAVGLGHENGTVQVNTHTHTCSLQMHGKHYSIEYLILFLISALFKIKHNLFPFSCKRDCLNITSVLKFINSYRVHHSYPTFKRWALVELTLCEYN